MGRNNSSLSLGRHAQDLDDRGQRGLHPLAADDQALEAAGGTGGKHQTVLVGLIGIAGRRAIQGMDILIVRVDEGDMGGLLRKQPRILPW